MGLVFHDGKETAVNGAQVTLLATSQCPPMVNTDDWFGL